MSKAKQAKKAGKLIPIQGVSPLVQVTSAEEFDLLKRLWSLNAQLRDAREVDRVLAMALRLSLDFFRVEEGCVAVAQSGQGSVEIRHETQPGIPWDKNLIGQFLRGHKQGVPADLMLARLRRHGRMWGCLAVRCAGASFGWDTRQAFSSIGALTNEILERLDEQHIREVRARIDQKIMEQIGAKSLFYQILHSIRSLVAYDHSAALLVCEPDNASLEIVCEQIAWRKAKSQNVERKLTLAAPVWELLTKNVIYGFDHNGREWNDWTENRASPLAQLLDYNRDRHGMPVATAEQAMLCVPLVARQRVLGVLKVAAVHPGTFGPHETNVLAQFLPQVSVAMHNMRRTESLEMRMREAERKQAMADLARSVSHDMNNALGCVLPLVQQLQEEMRAGMLDPSMAAGDLQEIERSLQVCRRIFGGMVSFARSASRNPSEVYLQHEIDSTLSVFRAALERHGIDVHVTAPTDLPPVIAIQADIVQMLLNLVGNARDAMADGGRLTIAARSAGDQIELSIADTGSGIPTDLLAQVQEPFFTTKPSGSGLGLAICRSIVSQLRGRLEIESAVGTGTTVRLLLPCRQEPQA